MEGAEVRVNKPYFQISMDLWLLRFECADLRREGRSRWNAEPAQLSGVRDMTMHTV